MNYLEKELEKLFVEWEREHKNDILYEYDTPGINGSFIPKENFIRDGFCVSETIKENTVLYISKESHEYNYDSNLNELKKKEYTYLKDCFSNNKKSIFARRIKIMQEVLSDILGNDVNDISFMNINKRGGFAYTDMSVLNTYAMQFSDNIIREIEIINPKIIVCCGIGLKRIINMLYKKSNKEFDKNIIEVHHPSLVTSDDKYRNDFIKQLNNLNEIKVSTIGECSTNLKTNKTKTSLKKNSVKIYSSFKLSDIIML